LKKFSSEQHNSRFSTAPDNVEPLLNANLSFYLLRIARTFKDSLEISRSQPQETLLLNKQRGDIILLYYLWRSRMHDSNLIQEVSSPHRQTSTLTLAAE